MMISFDDKVIRTVVSLVSSCRKKKMGVNPNALVGRDVKKTGLYIGFHAPKPNSVPVLDSTRNKTKKK